MWQVFSRRVVNYCARDVKPFLAHQGFSKSLLRSCASCVLVMAGGVHASERSSESFVGADRIYNEATIESRIFGGGVAQTDAWPSIAGIAVTGDYPLEVRFFCGGTVVSDRWILTAAHCVFDAYSTVVDPSDISVVVGINDLQDETATEMVVSEVIVHPLYDAVGGYLGNDVALLKLASSVSAPAITLFDGDTETLSGTFGFVAGWGATGVDETNGADIFPNLLQDASVPLVPLERCNSAESYQGIITDTQVCAGYIEGGIDSCVGDSGGPLFIIQDDIQVQVGVTSFGNGCGLPNFYGVYTNISAFRSWVNEYIDDTNATPENLLASTGETGSGAGDVGAATAGSTSTVLSSSAGSLNFFYIIMLLGLGYVRHANAVHKCLCLVRRIANSAVKVSVAKWMIGSN